VKRIANAWVAWEGKNGRKHAMWRMIPEPDHYTSNGHSHIESYVTKLITATESFSSLIISTPDEKVALVFLKQKTKPYFMPSVDFTSGFDEEIVLREFFTARDLAPVDGYLAMNKDLPDATRMLHVPIPSNVEYVTALAKDLLGEVYGVDEHAALDFRFGEGNARPHTSLRSRILGIIFGWLIKKA
jgi:hypothetical protein